MKRITATLAALGLLMGLTPAASAADDSLSSGLGVALNASNELLSFDPRRPDEALNRARLTVTNLKPDERLVGIDARPLTGRLYAIGSTSQVYAINLNNGFATPVGAPFSPALDGTEFGVDFNPQADRIRVVSNTGQNLRINPDTGGTVADTTLAFADADANAGRALSAVGAAYTNNVARAAGTALYDIDAGLDVLIRQAPPNDGVLNTVGLLGFDATRVVGFDISSTARVQRLFGTSADLALAALQGPDASAHLFTIDLETGRTEHRGALLPGESVQDFALAVDMPQLQPVYALSASNELLGIHPFNAEQIQTRVAVTGLQPGESLVGIDFRPATGRLYAVGSTSRIYVIDPVTGTAVAIGAGAFSPALDGTDFGVDFNPQVDRLRVVSNTGQNLRLHPDTGAVAANDTRLIYASGGGRPNIVAAAYANNFSGTTSTTLIDVDSTLDVVATQAPPNDGRLNKIGELGLEAGDKLGFDIATGAAIVLGSDGDTALAALQRNGTSKLYSIDLQTGRARERGTIGDGTDAVTDIAISPLS